MEEHRLDKLFGWGFHDRYVEFIKNTTPGSSIEWSHQRLACMKCGALVSFPLIHKDWHKRNGEV